ncbi:transcriptional regulator NanR [Dongia deserti]|uniref:transcriptional regulator NanR n=1 Tax=Dongia deserti TaxID=2268030 RepID=UPI000E65C06C|nr:transcriptional regulator NanR [Dongia deserti]
MTVIRRRKLYEEIAQHLEQRIRDQAVAPGEQLPSERDLMREFGVGRPAVREALFHLQKMGLVELRSGGRARATRPTPKVVVESLAGTARYLLAQPDGVRHFQQARSFFESGLARYAAVHATDEELRDLREALEANRRSLGDTAKFERTDVEFHHILAVIPGNPIFESIHAAIAEWLVEQRHVTLTYPGQNEIAFTYHAQIYEAIAARDPDRAERVIRAHLDQVADLYWRVRGSAE